MPWACRLLKVPSPTPASLPPPCAGFRVDAMQDLDEVQALLVLKRYLKDADAEGQLATAPSDATALNDLLLQVRGAVPLGGGAR